jgi:hypothetical protein
VQGIIPKGGFGLVLARNTRKGKKFWYAGSTGLKTELLPTSKL